MHIYKKVSNLIYFDGPLLTHCKDEADNDYLFMWCDVNSTYNKWLVFKTELLNDYMAEQVTLKSLILSSEEMYLVDIDNDLNYHNIKTITSLPGEYMPDNNSYHSKELLEH